MSKFIRLWAGCALLIVLAVGAVRAQDSTQEATAESTAEVTAEATSAPEADSTPEVTPEMTPSAIEFPGPGGYTVSGVVDGFPRLYRIYIPKSYTADEPMPVLFVFHGAGGTGASIAAVTDFNTIADAEGFIAVYPDGINHIWNDGRPPDPVLGPVDDIGFVTLMLETIKESLNVDSTRIYATGYSAGGMFSYRLGCDLPDDFAAVASVASTFPEYLAENCQDSPPMPLLVIQGTDDPIVPWIGYRNGYLSALRTLDYWGRHNGCEAIVDLTIQDDTDPDDGTRVMLEGRGDCTSDADVMLYGIYYGGHTWPSHPLEASFDLGRTSMDIDASRVIWDFFAAHPKEE